MLEKRSEARRAIDRAVEAVAMQLIRKQEPIAAAPARVDEQMTPRQVAAMIGCAIPHVYHLIAESQIRARNVARKPGKSRPTWRISKRSVREYLAGR